MGFHAKLNASWRDTGSMLCVGLDPDFDQMPAHLPRTSAGIETFCKAIVDATASVTSTYKPQIAYFASQRAEDALENVCRYLREAYPNHVVLLDAKRGDIGSTATHYAREAFVRYGADAVTVNPYLGTDSVEPFLHHDGKGVILLCRTSNPGGDDFQSLVLDGRPLYQHIAARVADEWNAIGECGLVVGATYPGELGQVRDIVGDIPILVPGVGFQGGDVAATLQVGRDSTGYGLMMSSSRAILYASSGEDFAEAAAAVAL
ncbi:MAG: orotidine-5'-phosphate decarboxylase, partial [Ilumatobacteraceae bacterium]